MIDQSHSNPTKKMIHKCEIKKKKYIYIKMEPCYQDSFQQYPILILIKWGLGIAEDSWEVLTEGRE